MGGLIEPIRDKSFTEKGLLLGLTKSSLNVNLCMKLDGSPSRPTGNEEWTSASAHPVVPFTAR
jgi:hypothetical protein